MKRCLSTWSVATGLLLGLAASAAAIEIRSYVAARHDRFTGFPAAPAWNATAWYPSPQFTGVGWGRDDTPYCRQFALVSPLHLVWATHYQLLPGAVIRFLNSDGVTVDRRVALLTPIKNDSNQNTDLTLVTLSSPLHPADKVTPFPYLNLGDENAYLGTPLTVFGWQTKAGSAVLSMFADLTASGLPNTRLMGFAYPIAAGGQDDVYLEIGDSGSPTFAMVGDTPALLGTHTTIDANATTRFNYDTFVPHYIAKLNAAMAADGYQMTPVYPLALAPSYSAWAMGLSDNGYAADPDGDGIPNLLEYAFGGDPAVASQTMPSGVALLPALNVSGSGATVSFPVRDAAAARGLTYDVEFSTTLETGSWSLTPPPGFAVVDAPFNPAVPGYLLRSVSFAASNPVHFCRVRVELNE
ncbi:MAG: trypsin-like serine protease [Verrucomicrobiota bacterium]